MNFRYNRHEIVVPKVSVIISGSWLYMDFCTVRNNYCYITKYKKKMKFGEPISVK